MRMQNLTCLSRSFGQSNSREIQRLDNVKLQAKMWRLANQIDIPFTVYSIPFRKYKFKIIIKQHSN